MTSRGHSVLKLSRCEVDLLRGTEDLGGRLVVGLRVALLYTKFAGMPQAMWAALRDDGHDVVRPEDLGFATPMSQGDMALFALRADADVVFCPFLKEVVPGDVCNRWPTWIPHPGVRGDAGPSSLSWAILDDEPAWGLTMGPRRDVNVR